jgi:hypothetical protein
MDFNTGVMNGVVVDASGTTFYMYNVRPGVDIKSAMVELGRYLNLLDDPTAVITFDWHGFQVTMRSK